MAQPTFESVFEKATGHTPFPYQIRLAKDSAMPWLMQVPTGCGKTAAAVMAWLYRRRWHPDKAIREATPRRLVYCLPIRVLVEQTVAAVKRWLSNLELPGDYSEPDSIVVHLLMGGETDDDWCLYPERDAIIIGTQDMLLSMALNRGFGMSRFRWPQAFGLINNDTMWIMDEVQLMGPGLSTSLQLDTFRARFGTYGQSSSLWMSATADLDWFRTIDRDVSEDGVFGLSDSDVASSQQLTARLKAAKVLQKLDTGDKYASPKHIADFVMSAHQKSSLSLVILNTVDRAVAVYDALTKRLNTTLSEERPPEILLVHSRFRPKERAVINERLQRPTPGNSLIIVSTQVVEAGVDISARLLVTELAPWASMVQRLGRANRYGEFSSCTVYWIDVPDNKSAPYSKAELADAREQLTALEGQSVSPSDLPGRTLNYELSHVLRAKDLVELFDTTPDISGNYLDPSRFIRDVDDHDVMFFWREIPKNERPSRDEPDPLREEICSVHIGQARAFLKKKGTRAYVYDHLAERWIDVKEPAIRPGQIIMVASDSGGYTKKHGFDPSSRAAVEVISRPRNQADSLGSDPYAQRSWQTISEHTDSVVEEVQRIVKAVGGVSTLGQSVCDVLPISARFHDRGKGHPVFVETMAKAASDSPPPALGSELELWAKAPKLTRHNRRFFRHELASAMAFLADPGQVGNVDGLWLNLAAYLVAAHHGKTRLSIRSMPGEAEYAHNRRYALGNAEGDRLKPVNLGGGHIADAVSLDLELMEIGSSKDGSASWLERTLQLRDHFGPFKLAYLEALLRAADARASSGVVDQHCQNEGGEGE